MCSGDSELSPPAVCAALLAHLAGKSIPHPPTSWPVPFALCLQLVESTALPLQHSWHSSEGQGLVWVTFFTHTGLRSLYFFFFLGKWQH